MKNNVCLQNLSALTNSIVSLKLCDIVVYIESWGEIMGYFKVS
jgi:hypothetical protein